MGKILSLFNVNYGKIEDLPFDIRHRKPISYDTAKDNLYNILNANIQNIIDNYIGDKNYYLSLKKEIDLNLQAILIDISKLLYFRDVPKCYDYNRLLHLSKGELIYDLKRKFLGFQIFKYNQPNLQEFMEFFNNQVYINFLSSIEKHTLSKIILQIRSFYKALSDEDIYNKREVDEKLYIVDANKMNSENPSSSFILLEKINNEKGVVIDGGSLIESKISKATTYYELKEEYLYSISNIIHMITYEINSWIRASGGYFIINTRPLSKPFTK